MKETLADSRWSGLADRLGIVKPLVAFRWLEAHYEERARKYHNARHINECLGVLDRAHHPEASNPLVEYALWFHDAIYNTFSTKNEERSADAAVRVLERSSRRMADCDVARELILATRHGMQPTEPPQQLLVDIDLAILQSFIRRPSIYATHEFRERLERQARNNIAWGLEQLSFGMSTFRWTARF